MNIQAFSRFVESCVTDADTDFTLDGEKVCASDLSDPHGLLPLILAATNSLHREISGISPSNLQFLEPADPATHLLGWKIKDLPSIPTGALLLLTNHCIRAQLASPPIKGLYNPTLSETDQTRAPQETSELRLHLDHLSLSRTAEPQPETPAY